MKKAYLILLLAGLSMYSCNKNYECNCKYTALGVGGTVDKVNQYNGIKKGAAESNCNDTQQALISSGYTEVYCILLEK